MAAVHQDWYYSSCQNLQTKASSVKPDPNYAHLDECFSTSDASDSYATLNRVEQRVDVLDDVEVAASEVTLDVGIDVPVALRLVV